VSQPSHARRCPTVPCVTHGCAVDRPLAPTEVVLVVVLLVVACVLSMAGIPVAGVLDLLAGVSVAALALLHPGSKAALVGLLRR
jgi:hypothetical protein